MTTEAAVSEALLTLSSAATAAIATPQVQQTSHQVYPNQAAPPSAFTVTPATHYQLQPSVMPVHATVGNNWNLQMLPHANGVVLETPKQARRVSTSSMSSLSTATAARYHSKPVLAPEDSSSAKKARTVSPPPAPAPTTAGRVNPAQQQQQLMQQVHVMTNNVHHQQQQQRQEGAGSVSCICPVCDRHIKGLGDHKVDWSQPVQGRQRAKTITSIKKHVKDFHENEPIWNVIVNSLDISPAGGKSSSASSSSSTQQQQSRIVTAHAFVTQALKKAALDQIPNTPAQLRSFRWTEKMLDQRVGIAKGFIQFGGQEYLHNKECQDEDGVKVNPKSLRNLAYCLLQTMYDELLQAWNRNQMLIEDAMGKAPLGLLRNRFQLLFAAPDKWNESWYMDPSKYSNHGIR